MVCHYTFEYLLFVAVQISKPVETTSEFQIQNEDFPALPGSKPPTTKANGMERIMYCGCVIIE